jgi:hypothetical protein
MGDCPASRHDKYRVASPRGQTTDVDTDGREFAVPSEVSETLAEW